jgi:hypothetical protein
MMTPSWKERLRNEVGAGRVIDEEAEISRYSYDWWPAAAKWRQQGKQRYRPDVVVRPKRAGDVSTLLSWASANGVPVTLRGAGSALGPNTALTWMERRFAFSTVENLLEQPGGFAETIEVAHFWGGILRTYNELKKVLAPLTAEVLGHFSHVYPQGTS